MYFNYRFSPCCPYINQFRGSPKTPTQNYALAILKGGPLAPNLKGIVYFVDVPYGTEVFVKVTGLPEFKPGTKNTQPIGPFGFHLHDEGCCEVGDPNNPFSCAKGHYNPTNQPHGNHAGDFPVLFSNNGFAKMSFFTNKFKITDIIGKSVIIHENPDDYRTDPAGNSGKRLACGIVAIQ
ncbi:superoxide dismutase family protein [Clostridium sp. MB40-C1]|uniref:superoxide dismutase family protein n=1 Tax=Clostridium sp. MB40-C1 TaxID=3070996 RepID=UPI0027E04F47|nr:superoxide dismutase family protein [Clostridium sp. MB40-C1]WMJ81151.1 superoxide dismutase family protein [Clostridium sp. MB40-C1]